jgi:hypothetical protein
MWFELGRGSAMILLMAAIATGLFLHAVQAAPQHGQVLAAAAVSMDNALAIGAHDGCSSNQKASFHGSCFAACAGVSVLPSPAALLYRFVVRDVLRPKLDLAMVGHAFPPDPYPPKS